MTQLTISEAFPVSRPIRAPRPYSRVWVAALIATDILMFVLSSCAATWVAMHFWAAGLPVIRVAIATLVTMIMCLALFNRVGLYQRSFALSIKDEFYHTVTALCLGVAPLLIIFTLVPAISSSRGVMLLSLLFSVITVGGARAVAHNLRDRVESRFPRRVAIVGRSDEINSAAEALNLPEGSSVFPFDRRQIEDELNQFGVLSGEQQITAQPWLDEISARRCDTLLFTEMLPPKALPYLLEFAARNNLKLAIAPPRVLSQAYSLSLQTDGQQALIVPARLRSCGRAGQLLKRVVDLNVGVAALLLFSPVMLLVALAVLLDSGRPIFYRQERVGKDGRIFNILKFRSMRVDAEARSGPAWASEDDPRRTRIGSFLRRTSLDELPQLFNVLRGDMSLVGPRPERPIFVELFRRHLPRYEERHLVRPGITGLAQVNMPRTLAPSQVGEKLAYDLFYVENWGLFMDFWILFTTAADVLFHRAS